MQGVDRPRAGRAVDHDLIRLEISLDRSAGNFRRRIAGLALGLHRQIDRCGETARGLERVLLGLIGSIALRRLGTLSRQRRLVANGFKNQKDRRRRRRGGAQLDIFRFVVEQRLQLQIVDRRRPCSDEVSAVELENARKQAHILLLDHALVARCAEHPVLLLQLIGDRLHVAEDGDGKAVVGEEPRHAHVIEACAVGGFENQGHVGAAMLGGDPVLDAVIVRFRFQQRVGALGDPHARERRLRLLDQGAVERDLCRPSFVHVEHRLEMRAKQRARAGVRRARKRPLLPIPREPVTRSDPCRRSARCGRASGRP